MDTIKKINADEKLYNKYINSHKISDVYDDENYTEKMTKVIDSLL